MSRSKKDFYNYFSRNLIKGFVYLLVLIVFIILFKNYFKTQYDLIEHAISDSYYLMFFIFLISELLIGILPPELFMIWSSDDPIQYYVTAVTTMTFVSIFAGWLNFRIGQFVGKREFFLSLFRKRFRLDKYKKRYDQYGAGLIIVAAITPLPFALVSLLTGTLHYPQRRYLLFSSFRVIRFVVYGFIIWEIHSVI